MSDEKQEVKVDVVPLEGGELGVENPVGPVVEQKNIDLQYGFVVGVKKDGGVVLDMVGEKKGLIEMLGLCKYAEYHLGYTLDAASGQGSPVISQQIQQVAEMMKVLINLVAQRKQAVESIQQSQDSRIITP